jgi:hypothetical protein
MELAKEEHSALKISFDTQIMINEENLHRFVKALNIIKKQLLIK